MDNVQVFIDSIASRPGNDDPNALWPCILINAFTSSNHGHLAPLIYTRAIASHPANPSARRLILRRIKESLLKGTILHGLPRTLNAFYPLAQVISDQDCLDTESSRGDVGSMINEDIVERGFRYFENIYRADTDLALVPMDRVFPALRVFLIDGAYGPYFSDITILSAVETSMISLASLLPLDVPMQVRWHMRGLLRNGGTSTQVIETLEICEEACRLLGVELKGGVPGLEELGEKLF